MDLDSMISVLEASPIIAATDSAGWQAALTSKVGILFHLNANIMTVGKEIQAAKEAGKPVFVHMDLAEGIGKDKTGIEWLTACGTDGIISTRSNLIRSAKECGLITVQRFFVLDTKGMHSISETISAAKPDLIEIMPGIIPKAIKLFSGQNIPVIAGGLIETKAEVLSAFGSGALAVSTGKKDLWSLE